MGELAEARNALSHMIIKNDINDINHYLQCSKQSV